MSRAWLRESQFLNCVAFVLTYDVSFGNAARARIQWLEQIIRDRLPDVDLNDGPQVNMRSEQTLPTNINDQTGASPSRSPATPSSSILQQPRESGLLKRTADVSNMSDHDESFPEKAHSVAVDLGMLSLNADSSQNHYLGSSSGLLFANLIGASPRARDSPSAQETRSQSFVLEDEPLIEPARRSFAVHYRALHQVLRQARANAFCHCRITADRSFRICQRRRKQFF